MAAVRGRGRGGGGGPRGGGAPGNERRGSWRNGPPGSGGQPSPRGSTPSQGSPRPSFSENKGDPRPPSGLKGFTDPSIASVAPSSALSGSTSERELQPWKPDATASDPRPGASQAPIGNGASPVGKGHIDTLTFGDIQSTPWDQFETNQRLTGQKSTYAQELYTTKLDRSATDYQERAERAGRLAREIEGKTASNPHLAEERGQGVDDAAKDEEERFAGVQRNPNAYVPPAARKAGGPGAVAPRVSASGPTIIAPTPAEANGSLSPSGGSTTSQPPAPSSSIPIPTQPVRTTSDTATTTEKSQTAATPASVPKTDTSPSKPAEVAPSTSAGTEAAAPEAKSNKLLEAARTFKDAEMRRVEAKRQAVQKSQRDEHLKQLSEWSKGFKVAMPMPADILAVLTKDEDKQKQLAAKAEEALKTPAVSKPTSPAQSKHVPDSANASSLQAQKKINMHIPEIPPFKARQKVSPPGPLPVPESTRQDIPQHDATAVNGSEPLGHGDAVSPQPSASTSADAIAAKLNPNASSFVFKPTAVAFKPSGATHSARPSISAVPSGPSTNTAAAPAAAPPAQPPNPFFGHDIPRPSRLNSATAFNPWMHSEKIPHANTVLPQWPFKGGPPRQLPGPQGLPGGFSGGPGSVPGGPGLPGLSHSMSQMSVSMGDYDSASSHGGPSMPGGPGGAGMQGIQGIQGVQGMQGMGMQPYAQGQPYPGFRFQPGMAGGPGMPNHAGQGVQVPFTPMFSPGQPGMQGQLMGPGQLHGPGQQGHMPMFFPNGMPQNPQFLPQHLQFQQAQRGMLPGQHQQHLGGPPGQGFYPPQMQGMPTPQQTPQINPHALMPPNYPGSPMLGGGAPPRPGGAGPLNASGPASQHGSSPGGGQVDRPLPVPIPGHQSGSGQG